MWYSIDGKGKNIAEINYTRGIDLSDLTTELNKPMKKEHSAQVYFFLLKEVFHLQFEIV